MFVVNRRIGFGPSDLRNVNSWTDTKRPEGLLYHYASLDGFEKIVRSKKLWASELHYLNDASEIRHFGQLVIDEAKRRLETDTADVAVLSQLITWAANRLNHGPLVFATSFSEKRNLLSQWRGYCPNGVGVSLGFDPSELIAATTNSGFTLRKCSYDHMEQTAVAAKFVDTVKTACENAVDPTKAHPSQKYHPTFYSLEDEFLSCAAAIKHPSFSEESEWRLVSKAHHNYVEPDIHYRAGRDTLVPYMEMDLPNMPDLSLSLKYVWVGPNPNPNLTMNSVTMFLSKQGVKPVRVEYCQIPFRA